MQPDAVLVAVTALVLGANAPHGLTVAGSLLGAVLAFGLLETGYVILRLIRVPPTPASAWLAGLALAAHMIAVPVIILGWKLVGAPGRNRDCAGPSRGGRAFTCGGNHVFGRAR